MINLYIKITSLWSRVQTKVLNIIIHHEYPNIRGFIGKPHQLMGLQYVEIGEGTSFEPDAILTAWDSYAGEKFTPHIKIGNGSHIGEHCHITACHSITIGDGVLTGRYVYISDNAHGEAELSQLSMPPYLRPLYVKGSVVIGNNVWIGESARILSGVTIGDGAIIGANAVVTHDVPANCVATGCPARIVKNMQEMV